MATYTIGRSDDNSIVLNDSTVSRQHAELETHKRGGYVLRDLDSTYGTRIFRDGEWLDIIEVEVTDETEVTFGEYRTTIGEIVAQAAAPAAAAPAAAADSPAETPAAAAAEAPAVTPAPEPAAPPAPEPAAAAETPPSPAPASGGGMDRKTTMVIIGAAAVLVLILVVVLVVSLLAGGSSTPGDRAAVAPPSSATRTNFEAALIKSCSRRYADSQCRCIARHMSEALTREELAIFVALRNAKDDKTKAREIMQRYGVTKIAAIGAKMATVVGRIQKKCGVTLKR